VKNVLSVLFLVCVVGCCTGLVYLETTRPIIKNDECPVPIELSQPIIAKEPEPVTLLTPPAPVSKTLRCVCEEM